MDVFCQPADRRLYEFVNLDNSRLYSPPGRVVNPGHAIESMWFLIHIFQRENDRERIDQAIETIRWHLDLGWDEEYGGLLLARDAEGSFWENKWDMKIWWPHTEALYALLLAYSISKEPWCLDQFRRIHDYAFSHFPVPGYGEWIQNLDRQGRRINELVALPVKDPFHLARALIYSVGVLEQLAKGEE
jgi:N-acylglucosamine 2-epimerase